MSKPSIIVLGGKYYGSFVQEKSNKTVPGCGFVGRNFVSFLVCNDLASRIRIVDKVPPQVAWLNEEHSKAFNNEVVEFKSANLINTG